MNRREYAELKADLQTYVKICNGLGPNKYQAIIRSVLGRSVFRAAADIHDVDYLSGNLTQKDCDNKFYRNCKRWINLGGFDKKTRWHLKLLAYACRILLKWEGHKFYNKRIKPIPFDELLTIARNSKDEDDCKANCIAYPDEL